MFSWAHQRQLIYGASVTLFLILVIGVPVYLTYFNNAPTCTDGKQNGTETGPDCGGICALACSQDVVPEPIVLWSRPFTIARGLHNLVAYIQNPNVNYVAKPVEYIFRVYDKDNVLLGTRIGRVAIPPTKTFPIFEAAFDAGEKQPVKAFFDFTEPLVWTKYTAQKPELDINDERVSSTSTSPRIDALLVNKTIDTYRHVEVVAIVYNLAGNAMASSRTYVDSLYGGASVPIVFTWPTPFTSEISKVEIIPKLPL